MALLAVELAPAEFQVPVFVAYYVFHDGFMRLTSEYILRTWSFWESFLKKTGFFSPTADFQLETLYKHVVSLFKSAWVIFIEVLNIPVALHIVILHREKHLWIFSCCSSVWELLLCKHYNLLIHLNGLTCAKVSEKGCDVSPVRTENCRGLTRGILPSTKRAQFAQGPEYKNSWKP